LNFSKAKVAEYQAVYSHERTVKDTGNGATTSATSQIAKTNNPLVLLRQLRGLSMTNLTQFCTLVFQDNANNSHSKVFELCIQLLCRIFTIEINRKDSKRFFTAFKEFQSEIFWILVNLSTSNKESDVKRVLSQNTFHQTLARFTACLISRPLVRFFVVIGYY
jgi:hypothetical protein